MPSLKQRMEQARSEELFEFPITGPFGGVQSELPLTEIENYGFSDTKNMMFRKGLCHVRPGFTALTAFPVTPGEAVVGIANFYNKNGALIQVVITPTRLLQWVSGSSSWTEITGPGLTGSSSNLFRWDVIGQKLCFSQGVDKVRYWDGVAATYVESSANAVAAQQMAEIGLHLVVGNTVEGGVAFPQRYRWTGAGDPTDWISFNAGINDNLNNLGPINGILKLNQQGYGFHQQGIIQIVPTGIGTQPFYFTPIINATQGPIAPYSLDHVNIDGQESAVYHTIDNVVMFNGSSVISIGDQPIDGRKRIGARSRILADLRSADPFTAFGFVTYSISGSMFKAYWLVIPNVSVWVYNFDEQNWTYFTYAKTIKTLGTFAKSGVPRIIDLIGAILDQQWSPATLVNTNPFEGFALGCSDGTVGYVDFTNYSEQPWQIVSAKHIFGDRRHKHSSKKFRLVVQDRGSVTYTITLTSETGQSSSKNITLGTGSGDILSQVVEFNISGLRIQWTVSGPTGAPGAFVEFCPIFDISGEQRGGSADNN